MPTESIEMTEKAMRITRRLMKCPNCQSNDLYVTKARVVGLMPIVRGVVEIHGDQVIEEVQCGRCAHKGELKEFMTDIMH